jgi:hypothetical protein
MMPSANNNWDDLFAELTDRRFLARVEAESGTEPLTRGPECLKPSQLRRLVLGEPVGGAGDHLRTCAFCQASLRALKLALAPDPVALKAEPAAPDPTAEWVMGTAPARRPKPAPAPAQPHAPDATDGDTAIEEATRISWTALAQRRDMDRLRGLLAVRVPFLLEWTGLVGPADDPAACETLAKELLEEILQRVTGLPPGERFTVALPGWVREFAQKHGRAARLTRLPDFSAAGVEEFATAFVLHTERPTDAAGKKLVRAVARRGRTVRTADALRMLPRPQESEIEPAEWASATIELYREVKHELTVWE